MPMGRAKSCYSCRVAKVRCSLSSPCSRCAKRHLKCIYAPNHPRRPEQRSTEGFRPIKPAVETRAVTGACSYGSTRARESNKTVVDAKIDTASASSSVFVVANNIGILSCPAAEAGVQLPYLTRFSEHAPRPFESLEAVDPLHTPLYSESSLQLTNCTETFDLLNSFDALEPLYRSETAHVVEASRTIMAPNPGSVTSSTKALGPQLSQRARSLQQGSLTAKMILSRLTDYTRKMADGRQLPPFIYPPCSLGRHNGCPPDSPHLCLPEKLAICVNLTQMFYSRLPGSHSFVWQQICSHIRQMHAEVSSVGFVYFQ
jgi:hypothetical protein